jgi:HEAT repeat protein
VALQRRRGLLEDMENLSEADTLLYFDKVAKMAMEDTDPIARATAIRLLWQSSDENSIPKYLSILENDPETMVRAAAATALGPFVYYGELDEIDEKLYERIVKILIQTHLNAEDKLVRRRALEALGYASHPDIPVFIQQAFEKNDEEWLQTALFAMGRSYDTRWKESIIMMLDHPNPMVSYEAIRAAGELELTEAKEPLIAFLEAEHGDEDLDDAAIWALTKIGGDEVRQLIEIRLEHADDAEEIQFLEEALQNLAFTEQMNSFERMNFEDLDFEEDDEN